MKKLSYLVAINFALAAALCIAFFVHFTGRGIQTLIIVLLALLLLNQLLLMHQLIRRNRKWRSYIHENGNGDALKDIPVFTSDEAQGIDTLLAQSRHSAMEDISARLEKNKYLALQKQINPHFLYNMLDIIRGKALMGEMVSVSRMLEATGTFISYSISHLDRLASLTEEIELLRAYIFLQRERFEDRLTLEIENRADDALLETQVPRMTLQPIVENAILHGFKGSVGGQKIHIIIERCGVSSFTISVMDNGSGMDAEALRRLNYNLAALNPPQSEKRSGGIGLRNIADRIRLIFGEEYGVTAYSVEGEGTTIVVRMPIQDKVGLYEQRTAAR